MQKTFINIFLGLFLFLVIPVSVFADNYTNEIIAQTPPANQVFTPKLIVAQLGVKQAKFKGRMGSINYCEKFNNKNGKGKTALIVVIHAKSGIGDDNIRQLYSPAVKSLIKYLEKTNTKALVLIPQCPANSSWYRAADGSTPYKTVVELVNQKKKDYDISSNIVYITGYSMGGAASYHIIAKYPNLFSKCVLVSSSANTQDLKFLKGNFYIIHGVDDDVIPLDKAEKIVNTLKNNPNVTVKFEKMENKSHLESITDAYNDKLWKWMFN